MTGPDQAGSLRILIVTDQYAPMVGGVPAVTSRLADGLARRGHAVAVLAPRPGRHSRREVILSASGVTPPVSGHGAKVEYRTSAPWPWYPGMRLGWLSPASGRALLARFRPDVMHVHSPITLGITALRAARQARVPVVYTNHYLPVNARPAARPPSCSFDRLFYAYLVGFANRCGQVTAPSATALALLRDRGLRTPSEVITNGVDLRAFRPGPPDRALRRRYGLPTDCPVVLSVGRLSPEKRLEVLLGAAARLGPSAHLAIAGSGPDEAALRETARLLRLDRKMSFLGFIPEPDLPGLYRLADVFAIASEAELQSLVTLEAMASGLPVVAADAGALAELVEDEHNGYLVAPGCSAAMAARLRVITSNPERRKAMAAASVALARGHSLEGSIQAWESVYHRLAGRQELG